MTDTQHLIAARELIASPENWTSGVLARAINGAQLPPNDPGAVRWCAIGALVRYTARNSCFARLTAASRALYGGGVVEVNDNIGHEAVLRVYDAAIAGSDDDEEVTDGRHG